MTDPRFMVNVVEWADCILMPLNNIGVYPRRLDNPDHWVQWAYDLMQSVVLYQFMVPDPRGFSSWQEWAERFNQVVPYR